MAFLICLRRRGGFGKTALVGSHYSVQVRRLVRVLGFGLMLTAGARAQSWDLVTHDDREYVTLRSFCAFYKLPYAGKPSDPVFRASNERNRIQLRGDSREVFINGIRCWLSFNILEGDNDWLIPRLDLAKLFEPLLRPWMIEGRRAVAGVVIDAGHGGADNGATSRRGKFEKDYTLDTALRLEKILKTAGIPVVLTRRSDVFVDLYDRTRRAGQFDNYIFVSLHYNFADPAARGIETYCLTPRGAGSTMAGGRVTRADFQSLTGNRNDTLNVLLASEVHHQLVRLNPDDVEADRGVKRARFVVLKEDELPGILVEGGFLTNRMEAAVVDTADYRQKLAAAVARGIQSYMQWMKPQAGPSEVAVPKPTPALPKTVTPELVPTSVPTPTPRSSLETPTPAVQVTPLVIPTPEATEAPEPEVTIYPVVPRPPEVVPRTETQAPKADSPKPADPVPTREVLP